MTVSQAMGEFSDSLDVGVSGLPEATRQPSALHSLWVRAFGRGCTKRGLVASVLDVDLGLPGKWKEWKKAWSSQQLCRGRV